MSPLSFRPGRHNFRAIIIFSAVILLAAQSSFAFQFAERAFQPAVQPRPVQDTPSPTHHLSVSAKLVTGTVGVAYNSVISVSGGSAPYRFRAEHLPAGLSVNQSSGRISGTPQSSGRFQFEMFVDDAQSTRGWARFILTVKTTAEVSISVSPATATVASSATQQLQATVINTSNTAVTWSATQGSVSSSGLYTAPSVTSNVTVTVTATSVADSSKSAHATISVTAKTSTGTVSLQVLFPPTNPYTQDFKAVQTYLMTNPIVSGGNLVVEWGMIDQGPGASPQYDWSALDDAIAPWVAAGKKINLIVWANSDSTNETCRDGSDNTTGNCAIPDYIWKALGTSGYTTCDTQYGTQRIPNYLDVTNFQTPYKQFIVNVNQRYGSNPDIGYIRFGLGHGGETFPVTGWNNADTACGAAFAAWGVTISTWETYLQSMLNFENSLHTTKQLMVGVTPMGNPTTQVPNFVAPLAVPIRVGFGSQGLQQSDIANYPNCTGDWCNLFAKYKGQVPLELQTVGQSDPTGAGATGSLVNLIPFAVSHHASVLEIYYQDWLIAFDPDYPGNSEYGAAYAHVLQQAARTPVQ